MPDPHLNLDRLRPGAVVVLPEHPDLAEEAREPAAADDEELRAEVARLGEAIAAEQRRAQEWSEAVAEAIQGWERDLAELRRLSG